MRSPINFNAFLNCEAQLHMMWQKLRPLIQAFCNSHFLPNPGRILSVLTFNGLRPLNVNAGRIWQKMMNYRNTLGPAYNEFGYNEHPAISSRFLCSIIIGSNVKKFGYNEHLPTMSSFFCIFFLVVSRI